MFALRTYLRDECGASMVEYGILVAVITVATPSSCSFNVGGLQALGQNVGSSLSNAADVLR